MRTFIQLFCPPDVPPPRHGPHRTSEASQAPSRTLPAPRTSIWRNRTRQRLTPSFATSTLGWHHSFPCTWFSLCASVWFLGILGCHVVFGHGIVSRLCHSARARRYCSLRCLYFPSPWIPLPGSPPANCLVGALPTLLLTPWPPHMWVCGFSCGNGSVRRCSLVPPAVATPMERSALQSCPRCFTRPRCLAGALGALQTGESSEWA